MADGCVCLSVVVPLYNEQENVGPTVREIEDKIGPRVQDYEVILVDDGSTDLTARLCDDLAAGSPRVRALHHESNLGYGAALRTGFAAARHPLIFYTDGDLQFDLGEIERLLPLLEGADIVTGYRINRQDPPHRRFNAAVYNAVMRTLFGVRLRDLDCAFKIYRKSIFDRIAMQSDGILISGEILVQAVQQGRVIREVGVTHYPRRRGTPTGNNPLVVLAAMRELVKFCWTQIRLRSSGAAAGWVPPGSRGGGLDSRAP
jgi:glycosyltransferase involved in cell wall biosynthesis